MEFQIQPSPTRTSHLGHSDVPGYAEGLWTPSLGGNTTYVTQYGLFVKIGRLVWISALMHVSAIGTGSTTTITGLPFPAYNHPNGLGATVNATAGGSATAIVAVWGQIQSGGSSIILNSRVAASTGSAANAIFANDTAVSITGVYRVE